MIGETLAGRYRIAEKLTGGRALSTYLAVDVDLGVEVEVDVLVPGEPPDFIPGQRREEILDAAMLARGPNVSHLFLWGEEAERGFLYVIREKSAGVSLAEILAGTGDLPPRQVVEITRAAVEVLAEIYGRGLFYQGLNPGQLYIDEAGGMKFIRVGFAWMIEEAEPLLAERASPYRAPETDGGKEGSRTSDVYSLAVMINEMLPGRGERERLRALLERAMDPIPRRRPSSPRLLLEELEAAFDGGFGVEVTGETETSGSHARQGGAPESDGEDVSPPTCFSLERRPRRHIRRTLLLMLAGGLLVWLAFSAVAGLLSGEGEGTDTREIPQDAPRVTLPDLQGLTMREAEEALAELGLECTSREAPSRLWSAGRVAAQEPAEGALLSPGDTVCLVISTGREEIEDAGEGGEGSEGAPQSPVTVPAQGPPGDTSAKSPSPSAGTTYAPGPAPAANEPPRAVPALSTLSGAAPLYVVLDGSSSSDPDGDIVRYVWYCGDGTVLEGITAQHVYDPAVIPERFHVVLEVYDSKGASHSSSIILEVY